MLKLLLNHWHAHRQPPPFVLTDDPLYCSHLAQRPFPEVYSVNRVNPIFEDDPKEDRRESDTRASDDTGYSSSDQLKSLVSLAKDAVSRRMSSESEAYSNHPVQAVTIAADVHRVSHPEDVIEPSDSSVASYGDTSSEPFDSLTMSSGTDMSDEDVRKKLQRLLQKGNDAPLQNGIEDRMMDKTKEDLLKSLTRAIQSKVTRDEEEHVVTRSDSAHGKPKSSAPYKKMRGKETTGVTRQDDSNLSSFSSSSDLLKHQHIGDKRTHQHSPNSEESVKCKLCARARRPLTFQQLLPGHWSYDNVYLPKMSNVYCPCVYHHQPQSGFPLSSEDELFYPLYYHHDLLRARHSWTNLSSLNAHVKQKDKDDSEKHSKGRRHNGNSHDTDSSSLLKTSVEGRRSMREPKRCKCEHCLAYVLDEDIPRSYAEDFCTCLAHRKVKFASDSNLSQHKPIHMMKNQSHMLNRDSLKTTSGANHSSQGVNGSHSAKENGFLPKNVPPFIPRGLKEPIKMDALYRSYPINFREWEAHYKRTFLKKKRKRALNMVAMAIGIVLIVGIAAALAFVFLKIRRPT